MPKEKNNLNRMVIILMVTSIIAICAAATGFYLYFHEMNHYSYPRQNNFSLNNETLNQTEEFFNNSTDLQTIQSYCQQKQTIMYCEYYCTKVNPEDNFCSQLQFPQFQRGMNFSQNGGQLQ